MKQDNSLARGEPAQRATPRWIVRCDATRDTGLGHLGRCLAIAEALHDLGRACVFAGRYVPEFAQLISSAGFTRAQWDTDAGSPEDAAASVRYASVTGAEAIIADDYRIGMDWLATLRGEGWAPVLIDDFGDLPNYGACRGVLNFAVSSARPTYAGLPGDRLLYGPGYFPARRELVVVRARRAARHDPQVIGRVLVTLGGRDRYGMTWKLLNALSRLAPQATVRALVGADVLGSADAIHFREQLFPIAPRMAAHFEWADACISGGGLTKYECAYIGLPVAIAPQSDAESDDARIFAAEGLGHLLKIQEDCLEPMLEDFLLGADRHHRLRQSGLDRFPVEGPMTAARALLNCMQ